MYITVLFKHPNVGLQWSLDGATEIGKVLERKIYVSHDVNAGPRVSIDDIQLAVLIEATRRMDQAEDQTDIEKVILDHWRLESENVYLSIRYDQEESAALMFIEKLDDLDAFEADQYL